MEPSRNECPASLSLIGQIGEKQDKLRTTIEPVFKIFYSTNVLSCGGGDRGGFS